MARIAGVKTIRNARGKLTHVTIDVRKHPQAVNTLKQLGLIEKTQFEIDCEQGISVEDAKKETLKWLREVWPKS